MMKIDLLQHGVGSWSRDNQVFLIFFFFVEIVSAQLTLYGIMLQKN